jgi:hypothetical protein
MKSISQKLLLIFFCSLLLCEDPKEPLVSLDIAIVSYSKTCYSIDLFWTEYQESDFMRYEIYIKEDSAKDYKLCSSVLSSREVYTTIPGLKAISTYQLYVRVITIKGNYIDTKISNITTFDDTPSPVVIGNIAVISSHTISIDWSGYLDTKAAKFDRYEVYYSRQPQFIPSDSTLIKKIYDRSVTNWIIGNLKDKTTYYFIVRTYNIFGKFSQSPEVYASTRNAPPYPVTLNIPKESDITESSLLLTWSESLDDDFYKYELYQSIYAGFTPGSSTLISTIKKRDITSYFISNLTKNEEYFFKIIVYDSSGASAVSNQIGITATIGSKPVPVELYDPIIDSDDNSVILSWSRSLTRYLKCYTVYMSPDPMPEPNLFYWLTDITNWNTTTYQTKGLPGNKTYYFRVRVLNMMGAYSLSNEKSITTLP